MVIDTIAHLGSLFAFLLYLHLNKSRDSLFQLTDKLFDIHLIKKIIVATIPATLVGLLFRDAIVTYARNAEVIATTTIFFAIVLLVADRKRGKRKPSICHIKRYF